MPNHRIGNLPESQIVAKRYIKERYLGKGGFAYCMQVTDMETEKKFAMKVIAKTADGKPRDINKIENEVAILAEMDHP
jgi:polo-like kinase 1